MRTHQPKKGNTSTNGYRHRKERREFRLVWVGILLITAVWVYFLIWIAGWVWRMIVSFFLPFQ